MMDIPYTKEALKAKVAEMRQAADLIYRLLQRCEVHPFIEFNGFMPKYIDLCDREASKGNDFTMASTHNDKTLPMVAHDVVYLAEKFDCIFGPSFRANPELWKIFKEEMGLP